MDRRPLGAPVSPHGVRDRLARAQAIVARSRIARRLIATLLLFAAIGVGAWLAVRPHTHGPHLLVGVDDDTLKWTSDPLGVVRWQHALGVDAVRIWVPWHGERRPRAERLVELQRAQEAAQETRVILAVFGSAKDTPTTPWEQRRFCSYAREVRDLVPDARALVVWNEANSPAYWRGTPAEYASLLARCYPVLHRRGLTVLDSTAAAHQPERFLLDVGANAGGRRLFDAIGHNPYPRTAAEPPDAVHPPGYLGQGDYARLEQVLREAFGRAPDVWYLENGFQTTVPPTLARHYAGSENVVTITPSLQARQLGEAIRLAACQRHVRAFFNFELVDETQLAGWQSGLVWRGVHRKPAAAAFAAAARQAAAGCPARP